MFGLAASGNTRGALTATIRNATVFRITKVGAASLAVIWGDPRKIGARNRGGPAATAKATGWLAASVVI